MATMTGKKPKTKTKEKTVRGYRIVAQGKYLGDDRKQRFFESEEFFFPEVVKYVQGRREKIIKRPDGTTLKSTEPRVFESNPTNNNVDIHLLLRNYLSDRLRSKYADFKRSRKFMITSRERVNVPASKITMSFDPKDIPTMQAGDLSLFSEVNDLHVQLDSFYDITAKRIAVTQAYNEMVKLKKVKTAPPANPALVEAAGVVDRTQDGLLPNEDVDAITDPDITSEDDDAAGVDELLG